jgi:hypothetical protein
MKYSLLPQIFRPVGFLVSRSKAICDNLHQSTSWLRALLALLAPESQNEDVLLCHV